MNAQYNLSICYVNGTGVAVDMVKAFKWQKRAAEAGHLGAQINQGVCYANSIGVAVDHCEAFKWPKRAAEAGT